MKFNSRLFAVISVFYSMSSFALDLSSVGIFNGGRGEKIPLKMIVLVKDKKTGQIIPRDVLSKQKNLVIEQRFKEIIFDGPMPSVPVVVAPPVDSSPIENNGEIGSASMGPQSSNNSECENLANHHRDGQTKSEQHFYADGRLNMYVGTLTANVRPEYKVDGLTGWKPMRYLGKVTRGDGGGNYAWIYTEPADGVERLTYSRTKENCTEYPDNRNQVPRNNFNVDWSDLASPSKQENQIDDLIIPVVDSSDLETANSKNFVSATYGTLILHPEDISITGLNVFGQDADIRDTNNFVPFKQDNQVVGTASTGFFISPKDYILDISTKKGNQRFTVHRNHQGGHFSVVTTLTRHDGYVFVEPRHVTNFLPQKLVDEKGKEYFSDPRWGRAINLGVFSDGEYKFKLYSQENVLIDPNIIVKVRRP